MFNHTGIAIDNAGGKLYSKSCGFLEIANLDATAVQSFPAGCVGGEVELDLVNGHVYWTENKLIRRASLDGTGITTIVNLDHLSNTDPRGLEIDAANNTIYFTTIRTSGPGAGLTTLERVDLNGANPATLHSVTTSIFGNFFPEVELDPSTNQLYFTDTHAGTISRISADGTGLTTILAGLDTPDGLDLVVLDSDGDGVLDDLDACADTVIPEATVPSSGQLNPNHWALLDSDTSFDTVSRGKGTGPGRSYTTEDTAGCSCEQIIDAQDLGFGHMFAGCSISAMDDWIAGLP